MTTTEQLSALSSILTQSGLHSLFQPIICLSERRILGYEALTRGPSNSPLHSPIALFAVARQAGRLSELEIACRQSACRRFNEQQLPGKLFLNVSPESLLEAAHQPGRTLQLLQDLGIAPSQVVIELTEQTPIDSYVGLEPDLNQLRSAGALIAVDDAGAGYAGLRHLLALRPSMIKIDRELIQDVDRDEAKRALIEMMGAFASRVDAWILAEGVERSEELDALVALGVPLVQGYYLARPGPPWAGIELDVAHRLASSRTVADKTVIRDIVEAAPSVPTVAAAADAFGANPSLEDVVLLGENLRPVAILDPGAAAMGVVSQGIRVNLDTPLDQALARSMTRPREQRYEALLVTDNAGRFAGVARMERMILALAAPGADAVEG